jgi:nucleoside-triphosphatase THEP1
MIIIICSGSIPQKRNFLVGKYEVKLGSFENVALPTLRIAKNTQVHVI